MQCHRKFMLASSLHHVECESCSFALCAPSAWRALGDSKDLNLNRVRTRQEIRHVAKHSGHLRRARSEKLRRRGRAWESVGSLSARSLHNDLSGALLGRLPATRSWAARPAKMRC